MLCRMLAVVTTIKVQQFGKAISRNDFIIDICDFEAKCFEGKMEVQEKIVPRLSVGKIPLLRFLFSQSLATTAISTSGRRLTANFIRSSSALRAVVESAASLCPPHLPPTCAAVPNAGTLGV